MIAKHPHAISTFQRRLLHRGVASTVARTHPPYLAPFHAPEVAAINARPAHDAVFPYHFLFIGLEILSVLELALAVLLTDVALPHLAQTGTGAVLKEAGLFSEGLIHHLAAGSMLDGLGSLAGFAGLTTGLCLDASIKTVSLA